MLLTCIQPKMIELERRNPTTIPFHSQLWLLSAILFLCLGCTPSPEFRFNEVELQIQRNKLLEQDEDFPDHNRQDIATFVTALFGTPDVPRFPPLGLKGEPQSWVSLEHLTQSAGPVSSDRDGVKFGLYREHCVQCHGITGDGRGPTSGFLNPYPRDFRLGRFKFKSTGGRAPPTNADLKRILLEGIPGTAMPSFKLLEEEQIDALVDYVKYLSVRGQVERGMINELSQLDVGGSRLILWPVVHGDRTTLNDERDDSGSRASENGEKQTENLDADADIKPLDEQLEYYMDEAYYRYLEMWLDAENEITTVPSPPESLLDDPELYAAGKALFLGKANCAQCHGMTGLGDGQTANYDLWTTHWLETRGVKPLDPRTHQQFIRAGAFPPRSMKPRNLRLGVFRGGNRPEDLYRRIANGIDGTPMPAVSMDVAEVWALVAYVMRLPDERLTEDRTRPMPTGDRR